MVLSVGFLFVCGSVTTITRNCVHRSSPNWLNFGRPAPQGRGSAAGLNFFGFAFLQPAHSVCVSLSAFSCCMCYFFADQTSSF